METKGICMFFSYYFFNNPLTSQLTTLIMSAPQNAGIKPITSKPSIKLATNQNRVAFITKVNKPKVIIVTGSVSITKIGLRIAFTKPKIKAVMTAAYQPDTSIPGR